VEQLKPGRAAAPGAVEPARVGVPKPRREDGQGVRNPGEDHPSLPGIPGII
jgi:hypothetical protein